SVDYLGRLGVFPHTCDATAASEICDISDGLAVLDHLVEAGVATVVQSHGQRYSIVEPIRQYVHERLFPFQSTLVFHRRFVNYFNRFVRAHHDIASIETFHQLNDELENVLVAAQRAQTLGDRETLFEISRGLHDLLLFTGRAVEAERLHKSALEATRGSGTQLHVAVLLRQLGPACASLGQVESAFNCYHESLSLLEDLGDEAETAGVRNKLGILLTREGKTSEAQANYNRGLALARESGSRAVEATVLFNLGALSDSQDHWDEAERLYNNSIELYREVGDRL